MFGYININSQEISDEDKAVYKAYYCGLCQTLKGDCGKKGQILLSFDMTFLAVLLTGLYEPEGIEREFICGIHPTKKRKAITNEISSYVSHMNILLAYHNCVDDWKDDRNVIKKAVADMISSDYKRISKLYPRQVQAVELYMEEIARLEENKERNIDIAAGITGDMLAELFAWKEDEWYDELKTCGYYMGKFIYMMDAYDDCEKDQKKSSYNPLLYLKQDDPDNYETISRLMMTSMMSECAKSFERMPILKHADILRNILYSGVWSRYEYIQLKKRKKK